MIELALTASVLIVAVVAAVIAWRSDATFKEEAGLLREATALVEQEDSTFKQEAEILRGVKGLVEQENATSKQGVDVLDKAAELLKLSTKQSAQQVAVLDKVAELLGESEMLRAREDFNKALDEADGYCSDCPLCSPDYLIEVPLDRAIRAEAKADKMLDAAELNRLAILGSSVWDVSKTEAFVKKARQTEVGLHWIGFFRIWCSRTSISAISRKGPSLVRSRPAERNFGLQLAACRRKPRLTLSERVRVSAMQSGPRTKCALATARCTRRLWLTLHHNGRPCPTSFCCGANGSRPLRLQNVAQSRRFPVCLNRLCR